MKTPVLFAALLCACAVYSASAMDPDLCSFDDVKLGLELRCIREKAWLMLRNGLDHLLHVYQCTSDVCVFNKICDEGSVEDALNKYMKPKPRREFWSYAKTCEKDLPPDSATE
ncbi:antimicrobial peptide microplusin-like [Haemaphysalis longicornis]